MRKLLKKIALYLNILVAGGLLLSYLAVHISPVKFALPAFFGLAYPYILLVNFIFMILWVIKLKREALISFLVIIIGITHLNNYLQFGTRALEDYTFNMISYNLRLFNHYEQNEKSEGSIIKFIDQQDSEIICLQEFYMEGGQGDVSEGFSGMLTRDYHTHIKSIYRSGIRFYGIVTLSSYPIVNRGDIVHPNSSSLTIFTDIRIGNDTIRIYNNHLQSFRLRRIESTFIEEISGGDQTDIIREFKTLSISLKQGFAQRAKQAQVLRDHIESSPYPVIVCGDFNDTPVSYSYRKIRKNLFDAFVEAGNGAGFTYRDKYPPNRIDYILYDKNFYCSGFNVIRERYSDHYPISAFFRIYD